MALKPSEVGVNLGQSAHTAREEEERIFTDYLEREFDRQIAASKMNKGSVIVGIPLTRCPPRWILSELRERYQAAGWRNLEWPNVDQGWLVVLHTNDSSDINF